MKRIFIISIVLIEVLFSLHKANAQGFPITPVYRSLPQAILTDQDRNIILLGRFGHSGFSIQKYDTLGNLIWARLQWADTSASVGYANPLEATDMIVTSDTGYLLCGDSSMVSGMSLYPNFRMITKYDKYGNRLWTKYDSTGANSYGWQSFIRPILNKTEFLVSDYYRMLKYDTAGNLLTQSPLATDTTWVEGMDTFNDTSVITMSRELSYSSIKYGASLCPTILETHGYITRPQYLATTTDSGYIVTGQIYQPAATNSSSSLSLEKYTKEGTREWVKYYHLDTFGIGNHLLQAGNSYIITGISKICENTDSPLYQCYGFSNAVLIKTDTAGNEIGSVFISSHTTASSDTNYSYAAYRSIVLGNYLYTYGTKTLMFLQPDISHGVLEHQLLGVSIVWRTNLDSFNVPLEVYRSPEKAIEDVVVFPNPGNKEMLVQSMTGSRITALSVTDLTGKTVPVIIDIIADHAVMQTGKIGPGNYILNICTDKGVAHKKIVVAGY